jgi:hypothetical protein
VTFPDHADDDCGYCRAAYRQGRSLASVESSAWGFGLAALGIVALLVAALVCA